MRRLHRRLWITQGADFATFVLFVALGGSIASEQNPIIGAAFALGGIAAVGLLKLGWVAVVTWRAEVMQPRTRAYVAAATIAAGSGILGAGFNLAACVRLVGLA